MIAPYAETDHSLNRTADGPLTPARVAALFGLILGGLMAYLMPQAGLANAAMWPLGMAISLLATGLLTIRRPGESRWELLFAGQILGVTAVALLLFARLA